MNLSFYGVDALLIIKDESIISKLLRRVIDVLSKLLKDEKLSEEGWGVTFKIHVY